MPTDKLREKYLYRAKIIKGNIYGLPIGKEFLFARKMKDIDGIEIYSYGGSYRIYFMNRDEVELTEA